MKVSAAIEALQKVLQNEGDLDFTAEGFFGEVLPAKIHIRNKCNTRNSYYCPSIDTAPNSKGTKVVQISHL